MCQLITPRYGCGHKDDPWLLYCKPTRKILGRKHPPLDACSSADVGKQEWNVFEPRCSKCERRFRSNSMSLPMSLASRRKSSVVSDLSSSPGSSGSFRKSLLSRRRRTGSMLDGLRDIFRSGDRDRSGSGGAVSGGLSRIRDTDDAHENGQDGASMDDIDELQMLELRESLNSLAIMESRLDDGPRGGFASSGSSSSLDSVPCSPRTTVPPTPEEYFP